MRAGHRHADLMDCTVTQAQAFLEAHERVERRRLAQWLGVIAVAAQGDRRGIEQLQRELLKD